MNFKEVPVRKRGPKKPRYGILLKTLFYHLNSITVHVL